ncbi:MAG: N-acetyl-gamma-glutamyl-phosphate reductase [Vulcanimicrobiaceae bacterium]
MTRVHVWGAAGYAAAEIVRILSRHPNASIITLESRSHAGQRLAEHFPRLRRSSAVFDESGATLARLRAGDVVFMAGAHGEAKHHAPTLLSQGARVIDLSADFRFDDVAVYGLPEWNRAAIVDAPLVANPGCYPTATLLATLPLQPLGPMLTLIVDAKSGITGAGRTPSLGSLYAEVVDDVRAYGLLGHRHQPEIERVLAVHHMTAALTFTPHVVPLSRGMLVDCYAVFGTSIDEKQVANLFARAYEQSPFIRLLHGEMAPSVAATTRTNDAEIRYDIHDNVVRIICAIDNLGKGAAGQAVQNFNIMLGYPEETALDACVIAA